MRHNICITGDRDFSVSGAVTLTSRQPTIAAAKALREAGAPDSDLIRVSWSGSPFQVTIGRAIGYRPSLAAQAAGRSGATSVHSHFGHRA
jgi:hypothetical protein